MSEKFKTTSASRHSTYYIDQFLGLRSAGDMLNLGLFPNAKEITESYAMFEASRKIHDVMRHDDPDNTLIAIGDGVMPRTAALFAYLTKWRCISIDPKMSDRKKIFGVQRLLRIKEKVENVEPKQFKGNVLMVLPHSHCRIQDCLRFRGENTFIFSMPCCFDHSLETLPFEEFDDKYVWSPKNHIKMWKV